jgi:hypothetical protein
VQEQELQDRANGNNKLRYNQKNGDTTTGVFRTIRGYFVIWWLTFHLYLGCVFDPGILVSGFLRRRALALYWLYIGLIAFYNGLVLAL